MVYAVKHMVPVWVLVDEQGVVENVVVEDDRLSEPLAYVPPSLVDSGSGWNESDEVPWSELDATTVEHYRKAGENYGWPAWSFGW